MDETYSDKTVPIEHRATSLTGVLIGAETHKQFRKMFYALVHIAIGDDEDIISYMPKIHAAKLFPGKDDSIKFAFFEGVVELANELHFRIYRVGYIPTPELLNSYGGKEARILGLCFQGLLYCLQNELEKNSIWPVMERDQSSNIQDQSFAGFVRDIDYYTSRLGGTSMPISNDNLGELLYSTKSSAYGILVDCIAYLLQAKYNQSLGLKETSFKKRLADISKSLEPAIAYDEVIKMRFH